MQQELNNADIHSGRHDVLTMHIFIKQTSICVAQNLCGKLHVLANVYQRIMIFINIFTNIKI